MNENYAEAVTFATEFLKQSNYSIQTQRRSVEPTEFLYLFGLRIQNHFDDDPWCGSHYTYPENAFKLLLMKSDSDKGAFDIACQITTSKLLRGELMSLEERVFAGMVMGGMKKSPPPEGKRRAKSFAMNVHTVYIAKKLVTKYGLYLTRNDENVFNDSACDAVSDAFAYLGVHKTWLAIKSLLVHKSSARVREIVAIVSAINAQSHKNPDEIIPLKLWV